MRLIGAKVLTGIELFSGIAGVSGGLWLIADPGGYGLSYLGYDTARTLSTIQDLVRGRLDFLPLNGFALLGAFLFSAFGVVPMLLAWGLWKARRWSWMGTLSLSIVELWWVVWQVSLVGFAWIQILWASLNLTLIILLVRPEVRAYLFGQRVSLSSR